MRIIILYMMLIFPAYASGSGCPDRDRTPSVSVNIVDNGVIYDHTMSGDQIRNISNQNNGDANNPLGLTVVKLQVRQSVSTITLTRGNTKCAFPAEVEVFIGYEIPQYVYVDRKYQVDSCQYNVITEHENQHVRINKETLNLIKSYLESALNESVMNVNYPLLIPSGQNADVVISKNIKDLVAGYIKAHQDQRNSLNGMLDTAENYHNTANLCSRW